MTQLDSIRLVLKELVTKNGEKKEWSEMNLLESSQLATMKRKQVSGSDYNTVYIINMASICNWRLSVCS